MQRSLACCLYLACFCASLAAGFKPGVQYTYQYETEAALSELQQQTDAKHTGRLILNASLSLTRLQFANGLSALRLRFLKAFISNGLSDATDAQAMADSEYLLTAQEPSQPAWFSSVVAPERADQFWLNLARGLASLLRYREPSDETVERVADAMGECGLSFAWLPDKVGLQRRRLQRRAEACENVELSGERDSANPLFSVGRRHPASSTGVLEFTDNNDGQPVKISAREEHELLASRLPRDFGLRVSSSSQLLLLASDTTETDSAGFETLSAYLKSAGRSTIEVALPTSPETADRPNTESRLVEYLSRLAAQPGGQGSPSAQALSIVQGLPLARGARDQAELRRQLDLVSDQLLRLPAVMELFAACGTRPCLGALFDFVAKRLDKLDDSLVERLLLSIAQVSRVGRPLLERVKDLLTRLDAAKREAAAQSALHALATLSRKWATATRRDSDVPSLLLDRLVACEAVKNADCQLAVLSAMTNYPSPAYRASILRGLLVNGTTGSQAAVARLRVLQASGPLDAPQRDHLIRLLRQRHVPLSDPVRYAISAALGGPATCPECSNRLRRSADLWLPLRRRYHQVLRAGHEELLEPLTSSAYRRGQLLSDGGVDFELDLLGNRLGGIRLSDFRLLFNGSEESTAEFDVLGVRLYADAVDSLLDSGGSSGGSARNTDEELVEEPTAGLQLSVLGEWLRPRRFFTGSSGLMSAVWNAPEDPVSVLDAGIQLHDFATRLHLQNGLIVQSTMTGSAALSVSGSLSVSIWNRDAASRVLNSVGAAVYAQSSLRAGRHSVDFVSQAHAELSNTFATFVGFAEAPVRTCLVMSNSAAAVAHNCHVTDSVGPRYDRHSHDFYLPGRSFSLGHRNDQLCVELARDDQDA